MSRRDSAASRRILQAHRFDLGMRPDLDMHPHIYLLDTTRTLAFHLAHIHGYENPRHLNRLRTDQLCELHEHLHEQPRH